MTIVAPEKFAINFPTYSALYWLFVVQIDTSCQPNKYKEWEDNSDAQPLASALRESADLRREGWGTRVLPIGKLQ